MSQAQEAFKESEGQENDETGTESQLLQPKYVRSISERSDWDERTGNDYIKHFPLFSMVVKLGCRTIRKPVPFSCSGVWLPSLATESSF